MKRTKIGQIMYNIITKSSIKLSKHKVLYYILSYTWGSLLTLVGLLASLIMITICKQPIAFKGIWYFKVRPNWGGVSLGSCFIRDTTSYDSINYHELGHTYQNAILGPFFIFLVAIPSAIRYWYREFSKKMQLPYDAIWFEGSATDIGKSLKEDK